MVLLVSETLTTFCSFSFLEVIIRQNFYSSGWVDHGHHRLRRCTTPRSVSVNVMPSHVSETNDYGPSKYLCVQDKIQNLDKLYSLYVNVIQTIQGYGDVLWTDVVSNIEDMTAAVNSFQARAKTLPKALRDWPAYRDCRCVCMRKVVGEIICSQAMTTTMKQPRCESNCSLLR